MLLACRGRQYTAEDVLAVTLVKMEPRLVCLCLCMCVYGVGGCLSVWSTLAAFPYR